MWKHLVQWHGNHDAEQAGMAKRSGVKNQAKLAKRGSKLQKMQKREKVRFRSLCSKSPVKKGLKKGL